MIKRRTYLFPGQGSQTRGMGANLFDMFPAELRAADDLLGYSLRALCQDDPEQRLARTEFTQPALYAVEALDYLRVRAEVGSPPDFLAGHSLGEFAALFAAGVFDFETGLRLVQKRGALMAEAPAGGMAAVLGLAEDRVREVLRQAGFDGIDIANDNAPAQVVISGLKQQIVAAQPAFEAAGARYVVLNVGAAFHSRYMVQAQQGFAEFLAGFRFAAPEVPVLSNVTARPHRQEEIPARLVEQMAKPVRWTESMRYLLGKGVLDYREIGPGQVLTRLVQQIRDATSQPFPDLDAPADPPASATIAPRSSPGTPRHLVRAETLGAQSFRDLYGTRYAYIGGSIMHGVASAEMVIALARGGFLGIYGAEGLPSETVLADLRRIRAALGDRIFGASLMADWSQPERDMARVAQYLAAELPVLEVSGFLSASPALVRYRLNGARIDAQGRGIARHRIIARVTRPATALVFLRPAPEAIVTTLRAEGLITAEEAAAAPFLPMADDICAQADGGGPSDGGNLLSLLPALCDLRDRQEETQPSLARVRIGAAGTLGTPQSMSAAFLLGAEFVLAASIHHCTVEAGTSVLVKEMLQGIEVGDTDHAPSGHLFEQGGLVQLLRKGVFFPARARKLHSLWQHHPSLESIDSATRRQIEEKFLGSSFEEIWNLLMRQAGEAGHGAEIARAQQEPKAKMALVFRQYFDRGMGYALTGEAGQRVNFQVHCGAGLGAMNQWMGDWPWQNRHVALIAQHMMEETASYLAARSRVFGSGDHMSPIASTVAT